MFLTTPLLLLTALACTAPETETAATTAAEIEVQPHTVTAADTLTTAPAAERKMRRKDFTVFTSPIKFGGYVIGKYSANDRDGQNSHSSFDLRFVRLYANGYCFRDFYYRLQMEMNDAPGTDKGPRIVDAFIEWQKYTEVRIKLGQFKRSFGFENPYSPLDVGLGSYSQASMKLASINDRCGEHKSSGRDVGVQVQGDLFSAKDGHKWVHYQVGLFNGQGINHKDKNDHKDLIGGLWFSPIKDLAIGGFGWNGKYTNESYTTALEETQKAEVNRVRWGAGVKYESRWTLRSEYMSTVGGVTTNINAPTHSDAWYVTLGAPAAKDLKIYGRWDCYRDAKTWSSLKTDYGCSANYFFGKNLIFQLNYTRTFDRSASIGRRYNTLDVQIYARF
jgi:hypothetical protein